MLPYINANEMQKVNYSNTFPSIANIVTMSTRFSFHLKTITNVYLFLMPFIVSKCQASFKLTLWFSIKWCVVWINMNERERERTGLKSWTILFQERTDKGYPLIKPSTARRKNIFIYLNLKAWDGWLNLTKEVLI